MPSVQQAVYAQRPPLQAREGAQAEHLVPCTHHPPLQTVDITIYSVAATGDVKYSGT